MKDFYDDYWKTRISQRQIGSSGSLPSRVEYTASLLSDEQPLGKVLDVGCGDGTILSRLMEIFPFEAYGVDISEQALSLAPNQEIRFKLADVCDKLPFDDNYFDVIICMDVLTHLTLPEKALKEILRVGKEEAVFILSVHNIGHIGKRLDFLRGKPIFEYGKHSITSEFLHFWTKSSFEAFLRRNGFTIIKVTGPKIHIRNPLYKLILRSDSLLLQNIIVKARRSKG